MQEVSTATPREASGANSATTSSAPEAKSRLCLECEEPLKPARLKAMPSARLCVPCQEKVGDVPLIRRYDEAGADGEVSQTYYTANPDIERERRRRNNATGSTKFEDDDADYVPVTPDPENTSVKVTNLAAASVEQGEVLRREASQAKSQGWYRSVYNKVA